MGVSCIVRVQLKVLSKQAGFMLMTLELIGFANLRNEYAGWHVSRGRGLWSE